ncbi:MAG: hypothetical protein HWE26_14935 [Alteromonadaceae bacterium]|nr:hypothetical protein [Alteromonadaceae bacterium]
MFSLTYSSAYDPYHAVFRLLTLTKTVPLGTEHDFEALRIVDFYHCFPWLLADFSAFTKIAGFQKAKNSVVRAYPKSRFDVLPDRHMVFQRMLPSQLAARAAMLETGSLEHLEEKLRFKETTVESDTLRRALDLYFAENKELLSFLGKYLLHVPLYGSGGLKDRSGLGEFRYDVV